LKWDHGRPRRTKRGKDQGEKTGVQGLERFGGRKERSRYGSPGGKKRGGERKQSHGGKSRSAPETTGKETRVQTGWEWNGGRGEVLWPDLLKSSVGNQERSARTWESERSQTADFWGGFGQKTTKEVKVKRQRGGGGAGGADNFAVKGPTWETNAGIFESEKKRRLNRW